MEHIETTTDPIRRTALAGHPCIVITSGSLLARVREAVRVTGRDADYRELMLGLPDDVATTHEASRSLDPELSALPTDGQPRFSRGPSDRYMGQLRKDALRWSFLPPFIPDECLSGSSILTIVASPSEASMVYAVRMLHRMATQARLSGSAEPALVFGLAKGTVETWATNLPRDLAKEAGFEPMHIPGAGENVLVFASARWGCDPSNRSPDKPSWHTAVAAYESRNPTRSGPGWAMASDGERTVFATRVDTGGQGRGMMWEVFRDGRCRLVYPNFAADIDIHQSVSIALRTGLERLSPVDRWLDRPLMPMSGSELRETEESFGHCPQVVSDGIDEGLLRAIGGRRDCEALGAAIHADPRMVVPRRDFALTWPAFAHLLLDPGCRARIDAGERTVPLIAEQYEVSPAVARRLVGLREIPQFTIRYGNEDAARFAYLAAIGHDTPPDAGDTAGWLGLGRDAGWLRDFAFTAKVSPDEAARLLLGIPGKGWIERAEHFASRTARNDRDMASALANWLGAVSGRNVDQQAAIRMLLGHRSILGIARAGERWHADGLLTGDTRGLPLDLTWPVPFGTFYLGVGLEACALDGIQALVDEGAQGLDSNGGAGLAHCVGGYGRKCQTGESVIVSIRRTAEAGGGRVSTAELVPDPKGNWRIAGQAYALRQHRGLRNGEPPQEASDGLWFLREAIKANALPIDAGALVRRVPVEPGRDPNRAACFHAAWRRILPQPYASATLEELIGLL